MNSLQEIPFLLMDIKNKIDEESKLKNIIFPLQKCGQSKYIPSSHSDLFKANYLTQVSKPVLMTNPLLFHKEQFSSFNPNTCNTGGNYFNNFNSLSNTIITTRRKKEIKR